jgi:hypothetical protein
VIVARRFNAGVIARSGTRAAHPFAYSAKAPALSGVEGVGLRRQLKQNQIVPTAWKSHPLHKALRMDYPPEKQIPGGFVR